MAKSLHQNTSWSRGASLKYPSDNSITCYNTQRVHIFGYKLDDLISKALGSIREYFQNKLVLKLTSIHMVQVITPRMQDLGSRLLLGWIAWSKCMVNAQK